jgi:hypothetical protein
MGRGCSEFFQTGRNFGNPDPDRDSYQFPPPLFWRRSENDESGQPIVIIIGNRTE